MINLRVTMMIKIPCVHKNANATQHAHNVMDGTFAFVVPVLILTLGSMGTANGALSKDDRQVLDAIRLSREATIAAAPEGHGTATLVEKHTDVPLGGAATSVGPLHIAFAFKGRDNIYRTVEPKSGALARSGFTIGDRRTLCFPTSGQPYWVTIDRLDTRHLHAPLVDERLENWSFCEFSRLPWNHSDATEESIFAIMAKQPNASVKEQDGKVKYFCSVGAAGAEEITEAVFDPQHGGMIQSSMYGFRQRNDDRTTSSTERQTFIDWQIVGGKVLPTRYKVTVRQIDHGKVQVTGELMATISIRTDAVERGELSMANMRIPVGTPVMDRTLGLQYNYNRDTGIRIGEAPVNALKDPGAVLNEEPAVVAPHVLSLRGICVSLGVIGLLIFCAGMIAVRRGKHQ